MLRAFLLGVICVQQHVRPYRRPSDNHISLLLQWLIFLYCATPLLQIGFRCQGGGQPRAAINGELIGATGVVFAWGLRCAVVDLRNELQSFDTTSDDAGIGMAAPKNDETSKEVADDDADEASSVTSIELSVSGAIRI